MPLHRRLPKRGFTNIFRTEYSVVNVGDLAALGQKTINQEVLVKAGLCSKNDLIKVLGRGTLTKKVTVRAHAFSKTAEAAITAAGGTVEVLPKPWGDAPRPPAKGNQHTNR